MWSSGVTEKQAYSRLARTPRMSARRVAKALRMGRSIQQLAANLADPQEASSEAEYLTPACKRYPSALKELFDPPLRLFTKGRAIQQSGSIVVSIVGSRKASPFSLRFARDLGRALASRGVSVCSGLALGVDAAAHRGALDVTRANSGDSTPPIGVLGHGWQHDYPWQNRRLRQELESRGILLTEYAPHHPPSRWTFPARNRIIAALSQHTVVVEAGERSGSLYTAEFALDLGREVWVVPQRPGVNTQGGLSLLADGAHPLLSIAHFCETLGLGSEAHHLSCASKPGTWDSDMGPLLNLLAQGESSFQAMVDFLQWTPQKLSGNLAQLRLHGIIAPLGAGDWEVVSPQDLSELLKLEC